MTTKWDRENILYTKWLDGKNEGLAEGKQDAAAKLKKLGVPTGTIAEATGLTSEEIEAL